MRLTISLIKVETVLHYQWTPQRATESWCKCKWYLCRAIHMNCCSWKTIVSNEQRLHYNVSTLLIGDVFLRSSCREIVFFQREVVSLALLFLFRNFFLGITFIPTAPGTQTFHMSQHFTCNLEKYNLKSTEQLLRSAHKEKYSYWVVSMHQNDYFLIKT